ncbi:MAG: hypothetical protein IPK33_20670 [Gemmatimonadetes bacterium]|nr:hypothetical protein [Gemmatimonadota bacterium]
MIVSARRSIALLVALAAPLQAQRSAAPRPLVARTVDSIVAVALKTFPTPGVAVAVIQDGKVVVAKGMA